jgi:hypothetical protein
VNMSEPTAARAAIDGPDDHADVHERFPE